MTSRKKEDFKNQPPAPLKQKFFVLYESMEQRQTTLFPGRHLDVIFERSLICSVYFFSKIFQ